MTNRISMWLFAIIAFALAVDLWFGWGGWLFLARKFAGLIDYLMFWR